ncbi:hypothetical protein E7T09_07515 [Deinococcus sp. KSM4-11]|uniref:C1 family peptidase n=1 Tax=Deinococcus sp. KSM4-11 TaxID=2568654 RepID=UPI0010A34D9F|nr:C1 family peptidase [Deinococcus sp. KSM4-11]THF87017.1 hypothetical protein E7T09_07515 [Deinococcus sp. KSM4-11]
MNVIRRTGLLALLVALTACSGPSSTTPPDPTLYTEPNAWTGSMPDGAEQLSPQEFQARVASGDLTVVSTASLAAQAKARQDQFDQDRSFLQGLSSKSPYETALLTAASGVQDAGGDQQATLPGGQTVTLNGIATQLRDAADAERLAASSANALRDYAVSYSLMPAALQARAASPSSLQGQPASQVRAALGHLNGLLGSVPNLGRVRLDPAGRLSPQGTLNAGNGSDNNGPCSSPGGIGASFWYPLKNFLSPIKDQGSRGTCWAFAAVAALDSREAVQNGSATNLSEQFLVNKVKQDWDKDNYVDGYWSENALNLATDKGQALLGEGGWTYNRSPNRPEYKAGDSDSYAHSCDNYTGTCSDSSHQSRESCTSVVFTFCAYNGVRFDGPGVHANHTVQAWKSGDTFDLNRYVALMADGHALLASFTVYRGFMDDAASGQGYVTNFSATKLEGGKDVKGSYGGHAVLIVGYIDNTSISANPLLGGVPLAPGGGGYFIVKNSWGCNVADAGYWYVPVEYVKQYFNRLSYLDFDARRSDAWTREQATPGGAANIAITTNPARADLRVQTDVSQWFKVSQAVGAAISLTVTTDRGEPIYSGPWNSGPFGQNLYYTFTSAGSRTMTLVAHTGATDTRATLVVNVVNTPPTLTLQAAGSPHQGEPYPIAALIKDINEPDSTVVCANTTWAVDAPDTLSGATGCNQKVTFGTTGSRQVRVTTTDRDGAGASQTLTLTVLPPSENPYPRVLSAGVYAHDFHSSGAIRGCYDTAVSNGTTIILAQTGCTFGIGAPPQRYSAQVQVENPQNEALTYDWTLYITDERGESVLYRTLASGSSTFPLHNYANAVEVTQPCRITVRVNAPDPARSKGPTTVWTGQCTYDAVQIN